MVLKKPPNVPTQEDSSGDIDLLSMAKEYIKTEYNKAGNVYLALLHRLDRPVGGVIVFAKTSKAANRLSKDIQQNKWQKKYFAIVSGETCSSATLINHIKRIEGNFSKIVEETEQGGKYSELSFKTLDYNTKNNLSLLEVELKTGRHHQIRLQLSNFGYPIWGDQRYNRNSKIGQQIALWSTELTLIHPIKKEQMTFNSFPQDKKPWNIFMSAL